MNKSLSRSKNEDKQETVWEKNGYFDQIRSDYNLEEKANFPENALVYINQVHLLEVKSKKTYYAEYIVIGQIHESISPTSDIKNYMCEKDEVIYYRPRYDKDTSKFLGLYETVGFLMVCRDPYEVFLSREYDRENSKVLYSSFKKKIPSSFNAPLFNEHIVLIKIADNNGMSQLFFFFPSNLSETLTPINVNKKKLDTLCDGEPFDPSKLDSKSPKMRSVVISMLEEIATISNSNLKRNVYSNVY